MSEQRITAIFVGISLLVIAIIGIGVWSKEAECAAAGGERLRPLWGGFECYSKGSLRKVGAA